MPPKKSGKTFRPRNSAKAPKSTPKPLNISPFPFQKKGMPGRPWNRMTFQVVRIGQLLARRDGRANVRELFTRVATIYDHQYTRQEAGQLLKRILNRLIQNGLFVRVPNTQLIVVGPVLKAHLRRVNRKRQK